MDLDTGLITAEERQVWEAAERLEERKTCLSSFATRIRRFMNRTS